MSSIPLTTNLNLTPSTRWDFEYDGGIWACELECMQCTHKIVDSRTGRQRRCKRKTCYTLPYCWQHLVNVYKLQIGRTTLKDSNGVRLDFLGLFACDPKSNDGVVFRAKSRIAPYVGEIIDSEQLNDRYPDEDTAPYSLMLSRDKYVDSSCVRGVGSLANACIPSLNPNCKTNAKLVTSSSNYPFLVATSTIRHGDEVFLSYGRSYFAKKSRHAPYVTRPAAVYRTLKYKCGQR